LLRCTYFDRQCHAIGTAGDTAMLCALAFEKKGITPDRGDVLVIGAVVGWCRWQSRSPTVIGL
jgi:hypothetical protein